jgi:hypothetical protein
MQIHKLTSAILLLAAIAPAQSQTAIPGVIAAGTQPELLQEGFTFTEGPTGGGVCPSRSDGNRLLKVAA